MDNAYYNPEKLGLEIIGEAEDADASYSFDMFVVWRDQQGNLYFASDMGCSCPVPFEDYRTLNDLGKPATVAEIHAALDEWCGEDSSYRSTVKSAAELHRVLAQL